MWGGISRTRIDGVEIFWSDAPGPAIASLTFRVGIVDETLYLRGIAHMIEHLALQPLALQTYSYNGFVDLLRTTFTATGEPSELAAFLRTLCAAVSDPPTDRLEHERRILLTESGHHDASGEGAMLATRYGPRGPGLVAYDELGLHHLEADRVRDWARTHFRPENAVLWLNKEPPPDLALPLDPGGSRQRVPATAPVALELPAWIDQGERGVAASFEHPRTLAGSAALQIAERRLQQKLRYDAGIAYTVAVSYLPLSASTTHSTIWTDVLEDNAAKARDELIETFRQLADEGPTEEEVEGRRRDYEKLYADPLAVPGKLDWVTQIFLLDPAAVERDLTAEVEELTRDKVRKAAAELAPQAVYFVPSGTTMPPGYARVPMYSADEARGRVHRPTGTIAGGDEKLVIGDDGVTLVAGKGERATIRFDRCEAMLQWSNGFRVLFGSDGFVVQVRPSYWQRGKRAVAALDERLAGRAILMKTDSPDAAGEKRPSLWVGAVAGVLGLSALARAVSPERNDADVWLNGLLAAVLLLVSGVGLWKHYGQGP